MHANLSKNEALDTLLFELLNVTQAERFNTLDFQALAGQIKSADEYATSNEEIEYENTQRHAQLYGEAIKNKGWDPSINCHKRGWKNFDEYLVRPDLMKNHILKYILGGFLY